MGMYKSHEMGYRNPMIDTTTITKSTVTRVVEGVVLPYVRKPYRIGIGDPVADETGTVFVDASTLVELSEQDVYDSQFGSVLLLDSREGLALEQAGLAVQETRGGYHGTDAVKALVKRLGWV